MVCFFEKMKIILKANLLKGRDAKPEGAKVRTFDQVSRLPLLPYHIWKRYPNYLRKHFWNEHTFWTDGYFACSVGNVSEEMLRKYIENQG